MDDELKLQIGRMSDEELQRLATEYAQLTDEAQALVRAEFARRSMEPPIAEEPVEYEAQGVTTVRQYRDLGEAYMARSVLESAGIPCFLRDENTIRMDWLWSNLMGGIRLQVAEQDAAAAEALLAQPPPASIAVEGQPDYVQPRCPRCGSLDTGLESLDAKVAAASMLVVGVPFPSPVSRERWHCYACGCDWEDDAED